MNRGRRRGGPAPNRRRPRQRASRGRSRVGERYRVQVGPVAHGGHCVARVTPDNGEHAPVQPSESPRPRVVFVRHAIPGEEVIVEITEGAEGDTFWRGDAVRILTPSPDRVTAPCAVAGPGGCGGCDFQHVALPAQRALKSRVIAEQFARLAGLEIDVEVEPVPGDRGENHAGLRWRTRHRYATTAEGGRGMLRHRSRDVVAVEDCLIAAPDAREPGPGTVVESVEVGGVRHDFAVAADGFWQVHPGAPRVLVETVLAQLAPRRGETVLDLYAGVGLFSAFLADAVGDHGALAAVEGDPRAVAHAATNVPTATTVAGDVAAVLSDRLAGTVDLVVLDPPREGARRAVVEQVVARRPRAVAYVACDPAALARDVATFATLGYTMTQLRAFDLFPMTHHVECVALLTPA